MSLSLFRKVMKFRYDDCGSTGMWDGNAYNEKRMWKGGTERNVLFSAMKWKTNCDRKNGELEMVI